MKRWIAVLLVTMGFAAMSQGQNIIDSWDFNVPDTNSLNAAGSYSDLGAGGETWPAKPEVSAISNNTAVFFGQGTNTTKNYFADASGLSADALEESGKYQLSVDVVSGDFANTAALDQKITWAIGIRGGADSSFDSVMRLQYNGETGVTNINSAGVTNAVGDADQFEIMCLAGDIDYSVVDVEILGNSISDLNFRQVYDLDAGTYEAYYTLAPASEVLLHSGTLPAGFILKNLRMNTQMYNGGSIWEAGDILAIDNIELTELVAPTPVDPYTVIEQWDFTGDSLLGVNSNLFPDAVTSVWNDVTGDDMLTMSPDSDNYRSKNMIVTPGAEDIYISWTIDSWDFSDLGTNSKAEFGLKGADTIAVALWNDSQTNSWASVRAGSANVVQARLTKGSLTNTGPVQITARLGFADEEIQLFASNNGQWNNWSGVQWADPAVKSNEYTAAFDFSTVLTNGAFAQTRMAVTGFAPSEQVTVDQVYIKEDPVLDAPIAVSIIDDFGANLNNTGGSQLLGTFTDVQPNDVMVVLAAGSNKNHIQPDAVSWTSSDGGVVSTNVLYTKSAVGIWYAPVQTGGTFDVSIMKTNNYFTAGAYLVRADSGEALSIDTQGQYEGPGVTSIGLSYSFGGVGSDGVVLESLSTAANGGAVPDDVMLDYYNDATITKRATGNLDFSNSLGVNTSWTVTQSGADKNAGMAGIALYVDYTPPLGTPTEAYANWVADYPTLVEFGMQDDQDDDLLVNLAEYAWDGSPVNPSDNGNTPVQSQVADSGTNYLEYVYYERDDAAARGLASTLEVATDLFLADWTTSGIEPVGSGAGPDGFNAITNRVEIDGSSKFLRLKVGFTPTP